MAMYYGMIGMIAVVSGVVEYVKELSCVGHYLLLMLGG